MNKNADKNSMDVGVENNYGIAPYTFFQISHTYSLIWRILHILLMEYWQTLDVLVHLTFIEYCGVYHTFPPHVFSNIDQWATH